MTGAGQQCSGLLFLIDTFVVAITTWICVWQQYEKSLGVWKWISVILIPNISLDCYQFWMMYSWIWINQLCKKFILDFDKGWKKYQMSQKNLKFKENHSNGFCSQANPLFCICLFCTFTVCFTTCYLWHPSRTSKISHFLEVVLMEHYSFPMETEAWVCVCTMCACSSIKAPRSHHQSHTPY